METLSTAEKLTFSLSPESTKEEVRQNIYCFLKTFKGEAPLMRNFGIDSAAIGKPLPIAESLIIADLYENLPIAEPRCLIISIECSVNSGNGEIDIIISYEVTE